MQLAKSSTLAQSRDILAEHLADRRSEATREGYAKDLKDFFKSVFDSEPTQQLVGDLLALQKPEAITLVLRYKAGLIQRQLAENTVNRRLAAIKSLVTFAKLRGLIDWDLSEIRGEPSQAYRDTTGIAPEQFSRVLEQCGDSIFGLRNRAILRLMWDCALRRSEVAKIDLRDYDRDSMRLAVLGKGRGSQVEWVPLSGKTVEAIDQWLRSRPGASDLNAPMFVALTVRHLGHRLTGQQLYTIVRQYAEKAGLTKIFSPHRVRHSALTALAAASGGDVRQVQTHARHKNVSVTMKYIDNASALKGEAVRVLGDLV
jgi:integrase/recombinase XerC